MDLRIEPVVRESWPLYLRALRALQLPTPPARPKRGLMLVRTVRGDREAVAGALLSPVEPGMTMVVFAFRRAFTQPENEATLREHLVDLGGKIVAVEWLLGARTVVALANSANGEQAVKEMGFTVGLPLYGRPT